MDFQNAQLTNIPPPKATNGLDGSQTGKEGENGQPGKPSPTIKIIAGQLLKGSSGKLNYASKGGEGGNGGTGKGGNAGSEVGLVPTNSNELMNWPGREVSEREYDCDHVCCNDCNVCKYDTNYWKYIDTRASCGTPGAIF